jgi:hypothetical protein
MKRALMIGLLAVFILGLPLTALASRRDYIEEVLDYWIDYAEDEGYDVFDSDISRIDDETFITYTVDLERGDYLIIAEGGEHIVNLDMAAWYEDDYEDGEESFVQDLLEDNYPVLEFSLKQSETIVVEVWVEEFERHEDSDYFCILIAEY